MGTMSGATFKKYVTPIAALSTPVNSPTSYDVGVGAFDSMLRHLFRRRSQDFAVFFGVRQCCLLFNLAKFTTAEVPNVGIEVGSYKLLAKTLYTDIPSLLLVAFIDVLNTSMVALD